MSRRRSQAEIIACILAEAASDLRRRDFQAVALRFEEISILIADLGRELDGGEGEGPAP